MEEYIVNGKITKSGIARIYDVTKAVMKIR